MGEETISARMLAALRLALGAFFLAAGLAKVFAPDIAASFVAEAGLPGPRGIALAIGAAEAFAGIVLIADARTRTVARALIAFVALVAIVFHNPIGLPPGIAHMTRVSLAVDLFVVLGLWILARGSPRPAPI